MLQWILIILIFNIFDICNCYRRIYILHVDDTFEKSLTSTIEVIPGTNLTLRCALSSNQDISDPGFTWGHRTKQIPFHNEYDLYQLLESNNQHILALQSQSDGSDLKQFLPFTHADRGVYFCMSAKYKLFKVIHIKVKNRYSSCINDMFRCISNGYCISSHYQCDGKEDCPDGSDEFSDVCYGDPCQGKIKCDDGRCIPKSWCCDRRIDAYCTVSIRHHCCPILPNPYDPLNFYNQNANDTMKEISRGGGPRYLFIAVCVVSAILSFVLFLFIISKVCGFDKRPQHASNNNANIDTSGTTISNCGHPECTIRRDLTTNQTWCLYHPGEVSDPLITGNSIIHTDQPPSYAEVVNLPPSIDKGTLEDLINAPPPPYSSTKNIASNQESLRCDTNV